MKTLNPIENEINRIRLDIYDKTKDMTPSQLTDYYLKSGESSARKYGFTIIRNARDKEQRVIQVNS